MQLKAMLAEVLLGVKKREAIDELNRKIHIMLEATKGTLFSELF
jgi:hypothetical protein